jgi:hypothetical protein
MGDVEQGLPLRLEVEMLKDAANCFAANETLVKKESDIGTSGRTAPTSIQGRAELAFRPSTRKLSAA